MQRAILTPRRTEFAKKMRKDYESHRVHYRRNELRVWEPREDGCSNTITTVQKDNYLIEYDTDTECDIERLSGMQTGGGIRCDIPLIEEQKRKGSGR